MRESLNKKFFSRAQRFFLATGLKAFNRRGREEHPQRAQRKAIYDSASRVTSAAKAESLRRFYGTTEVVPFPILCRLPTSSYRSTASVAGNDGRFDVAAAVHHVAKDLLEARQRGFASDVVGGANLFGGDQAKGTANRFRRVMERGLERDFRIVQAIGIELHFGAAGASAKKVYGAAFADHFYCPLPGFGTAHCFNDDIATALLRS